MKIELICDQCGKPFLRDKKKVNSYKKQGRKAIYCSNACVNLGNLKHRSIEKECLWCGNSFVSSTNLKARKCCSRSCANHYSQLFVI